MKKIFTLLVMVALATCWVSCSDDDDKEDSPTTKKLISKIEYKATDDSYHIIWEYTYNSDQTIKKITQNTTEYGELYTQVNELEHSKDKLIIHVKDSDYEGQPLQYDITCTLNSQKNVTDIKANIDCASNNGKFTYSDDNYLIKNTIEYIEEFTWVDDILVEAGDVTCTQSSIENKTNIDLNQIFINYPNTDGDFDVTALTDYIGGKSKYLILSGPTPIYIKKYEYTIDEEGYPIEIREINPQNEQHGVYKITYTK